MSCIYRKCLFVKYGACNKMSKGTVKKCQDWIRPVSTFYCLLLFIQNFICCHGEFSDKQEFTGMLQEFYRNSTRFQIEFLEIGRNIRLCYGRHLIFTGIHEFLFVGSNSSCCKKPGFKKIFSNQIRNVYIGFLLSNLSL